MKGHGIVEAKCARCGKQFIVQPGHVYRKNSKIFCRYNCYNAYLNEVEQKKLQRRLR
jgi:hypothetical protein